MNTETCWIETKASQLIAAANQSEWKTDIFDDASRFREEGFVGDVALAMACRYWLS